MTGLQMKYFVLNPRSKTTHVKYAQASRKAMRAYAHHIGASDSELSMALMAWVDRENLKELMMRDLEGTLPSLPCFNDDNRGAGDEYSTDDHTEPAVAYWGRWRSK